jgi:hypothetical protein
VSAIEQIVDAYVRLGNHKALEDLLGIGSDQPST